MRRVCEEQWSGVEGAAAPWAFERRRALLLDELRPGERWLDLGCGAGHFTELAPDGVGVDIAEAALERAHRNAPGIDFRLLDGDQIPLGHGEVELVWCSEVLAFVPDALGLLGECRRVLAPGGRLLVTTPGHPWWRRLRATDPLGQGVRFYTRATLGEVLRAAGFDDVRVRGRSWLVGRGVRA